MQVWVAHSIYGSHLATGSLSLDSTVYNTIPGIVCFAVGFCGDRRPSCHVFHTSRQAMIKTYYSTSIRKNMIQNCSYFTQMKSTTTAIDDSNRRRNKLGLGCSREETAPLILIFKLRFLWLNIGRYFKGITQFHNCHSPKHTSKKYYLIINIFRKICTKIIT